MGMKSGGVCVVGGPEMVCEGIVMVDWGGVGIGMAEAGFCLGGERLLDCMRAFALAMCVYPKSRLKECETNSLLSSSRPAFLRSLIVCARCVDTLQRVRSYESIPAL